MHPGCFGACACLSSQDVGELVALACALATVGCSHIFLVGPDVGSCALAGLGFFAMPTSLASKEVSGDDGGLCPGPPLLIAGIERCLMATTLFLQREVCLPARHQ